MAFDCPRLHSNGLIIQGSVKSNIHEEICPLGVSQIQHFGDRIEIDWARFKEYFRHSINFHIFMIKFQHGCRIYQYNSTPLRRVIRPCGEWYAPAASDTPLRRVIRPCGEWYAPAASDTPLRRVIRPCGEWYAPAASDTPLRRVIRPCGEWYAPAASDTPLRRVICLSGEIDVRRNLQKGTQAYSRFDRNIHKYYASAARIMVPSQFVQTWAYRFVLLRETYLLQLMLLSKNLVLH